MSTAVSSSGATQQIVRVPKWVYRSAYHRTALRSNPKILCNSFHKAGTHLLLGAVAGIPGAHHYGRAVYWHSLERCLVTDRREVSPAKVRTALTRCLPGEIYRGHVAYDEEVSRSLDLEGFRHVLICRDLRDTVVSLLFWWKRHERKGLWPYRYFQSLQSDDERLRFLIEGWPRIQPDSGFPEDIDYPDVGTRFREFLPWFSNPRCLVVRFEDLVDEEIRIPTYSRIAKHLFPHADPEFTERVAGDMVTGTAPSRSKTFRKGATGEWRKTFSPEHIESFKQYAGDLLITLGYEANMDWRGTT